ncbi:hypothetical protein [Kitasatospora sp. MBT63]|uniref:hypothetical protein n=1 Tax=Kitasatospora sp. MBT63 TaxID=1444768 RepID=UPI00053A2F25|nr:hypothetical protein [Kitasatospora sp. MBT63]
MGEGLGALIAGSGDDPDSEPPVAEIGAPLAGPPFTAATGQVAVTVSGLLAYNTGLEIALEVRFNATGTPPTARSELENLMREARHGGADRLHLALDLPDGRVFRNNRPHPEPAERPAESAPMLLLRAGSHGPSWRLGYWLRPLPVDGGRLRLCRPVRGVDASFEVPAGAVAEARAAVRRLWP